MRNFSVEQNLKKKLKIIFKKDKIMYKIVLKKFTEIIECKDINHYKNLRKPLQNFKRVHVKSSFVLIFKFVEEKVIFYDLDHHDNIHK